MAKRRLLDLAAEGGQQLAQDIRDLLFIHNTDAQKLSRQQAMGGMPNPSIAVTQRDIPFEGFGDISLIGRPERFDPSSRQNPLFSADAYTVRTPSPVRVANKNAYKQFKSDYEPYKRSGNIDDVAYSLGDLESKSRIEPSDFRRVNDFFEYDNAAKLKFAQDNNISVPRKENGDIDYYALSDIKSQNADKYEQWRQEEVSKYFQPEEYFVTNPDYDRYSGRAKLQPYTAENVSKWMSKRSGAGQESTMTFGAGNVRASTTEQIKSLEQARQMKGLLKPADEMAEFKQTSDMMLGDLQDALKDYYQYDTNSFSYFDSVGEMIALSEKKGLKRAMQEVGFKDVPDVLVKEIEGYKDYLRSAPTEYFESKPNRPVGLGEFGGAIVPESTPQGLIEQLIQEGLRVEKYADEADRVAKRGAFENLMFTRPETVVGAGLLGAGVLGAMAPQEAQAGGLTKISDLIKLGYPESVAERIASGELPMDYASRMQRAAEQGYGDIADPANRFYHGTSANIREILNSESGALGGGGVYITPSPEKASGYAQIAERVLHRGSSQNVLPLVTNINSPYHFEDYSNIPLGGINDELLRNLGYDALSVSNKGGPVEELKVPSNRVRSVNAAFDPKYTGSNILGSRVIPTTAAGLLAAGAMAPEDAEAATGYKLFRQVDGKLYPLFVNRSTEVPMGEWLKAEAGELTPEGKVKSSLGPLAYRPGWHAGDLPIATHIGGKSGPVKAPNYRPNDQVWAEVEFPEGVDWQAIANANATRNKAGEIIPRTAQITDQVPYGGFYRYKTNPNMTGEWMIGGDMKVNRVLSDEEVQAINEASGVADLPRLQSIKDKTMLATPIAGAGLMAALAPDQVQAQELDPNLPLTIGSPKQEVNYQTMPSYYDYGDGATIPVRPPEPVKETKPEYLPAGMPVNPYTFMMSQGATQGEAARTLADAYSEIARGTANAIGGFGGEMEALGKGLLFAITGGPMGGTPFSRFMGVLGNYDPQLPNTQDVSEIPALLPNISPMTEEERRMYRTAGEFLSPL